jgi:zinc protease
MQRAVNYFKRFFTYVFTVFLVLLLLNQGRVMAKVTHVKSYGGIEEYKLDNGLKILLKQNNEAPLISFQVWYRAGSRNERNGYTGLAHYLEHMMFKGTKQFRKGEIAQSIELKGGIFNAFTSDDYTAYYENFAPEHLELGIKIESDRMCNSLLRQEELKLERSVVISELEGRDNSPHSIIYRSLKAAAYDVHPYHNPIIGWIDDLHNIDSKIMREFYETFYHPNNAVAVLVGNFDKPAALSLIDRYFSPHKASTIAKPPVAKEPEQIAYKEVDIHEEGFVKLLAMAFHVPEFAHADTAALQLFGDIGFGGTSSRLYKKLVDTGLALSVSGYSESNLDPTIFRIMVNLSPDADINKVQSIIEAEIEAMKTNISADELKRAKARIEASSIYERDGIYEEGLQIAYFEMVANDWTKYVDWVDLINKVKLEDLSRIASLYFIKTNETVARYLPTKAPSSLVAEDTEAAILAAGGHRSYASGAGAVERIDPKQMKRLLTLTQPKT